MRASVTFLILSFLILVMSGLQAQTVDYKTGYQFPTFDQDSVLSGLKSVRGCDYHANPLGNGVAAFVATNYFDNGHIHIFKNAGNDSMELVWTSPRLPNQYGSSAPRMAIWGDMDNDGIIEVICPMDTSGIYIYEWDGVTDSWNFGDIPTKIIRSPEYPVEPDSSGSYARAEFLEVKDYDNDGQNELSIAVNASNSAFDRYYILSIDGEYSTGNPGFTSVKREAMWAKNWGEFAIYGGGSPYAMVGADLDGAGNLEIVIHPWNYGNVTPVRVTGKDTYVLADTAGGTHYYYSTYPIDAVSLGGGTAFDIDDDGREEVYFPLYGAGKGTIIMVHYEDGDDLAKIDSSNLFLLDVSSVYSSSSMFGLAGFGDYDDDGKPNLYFAGSQKKYIISSEFQGGDKTDQANWTHEILYTGLELDSKIFSKIVVTDSAGIVDTVKVLRSESEGTIAFKIGAEFSDFDGDGFEDIIMPTQAWLDSVDNIKYTFIKDTAYTVYDTSFAGTDTMEIDTIYIETTIWDTTSFNSLESHRIGIRMLESSVLNTLESRELTVITPDQFELEQNYPNPFNPTTSIKFYLPIEKRISLTIYNSLGQKVVSLINDERYNKGTHSVEWDATNSKGYKVASGMYIYELKHGNFRKHKKMMLLK